MTMKVLVLEWITWAQSDTNAHLQPWKYFSVFSLIAFTSQTQFHFQNSSAEAQRRDGNTQLLHDDFAVV